MKCRYCSGEILDCRMDSRGLCVKHPLSDGKPKKRTKKEKESDRRMGKST